MKTAFVMTGKANFVEDTFPLMKKHVFERIDCDVHMHVEKNSYDRLMDAVRASNIKFKSLIVTEDVELTSNAKALYHIKRKKDKVPRDHTYFQRYLLQLYYINKAFNFVFDFYPRYDWYVRCRFDMEFNEDIDNFEEYDPSCLYVPSVNPYDDWYNDRFGFGGYDVMKIYADRYDLIDTYPTGLKLIVPEKELAYTMNKHNIERKFCKCTPVRWKYKT
jgi:hypothetical protein